MKRGREYIGLMVMLSHEVEATSEMSSWHDWQWSRGVLADGR